MADADTNAAEAAVTSNSVIIRPSSDGRFFL